MQFTKADCREFVRGIQLMLLGIPKKYAVDNMVLSFTGISNTFEWNVLEDSDLSWYEEKCGNDATQWTEKQIDAASGWFLAMGNWLRTNVPVVRFRSEPEIVLKLTMHEFGDASKESFDVLLTMTKTRDKDYDILIDAGNKCIIRPIVAEYPMPCYKRDYVNTTRYQYRKINFLAGLFGDIDDTKLDLSNLADF